MNRNKLKNYAPQARRDFIRAVTGRAGYYGLTKGKIEPVTEQGDVVIIAGKPFPRRVAEMRGRLEDRIEREGFDQLMEAMAYTWFNRFVAIRFMELHGYLDHGYRALSHPEGKATPEILEHAEHLDLPGLDREKVIELKLEGTRESELYRMLLIAQCNALHKIMPFLFERVDHETELLLPENLLHSDSLIRKLVEAIAEEDWQEVEVIGWLYQFYISEKKDQVIGKVVKSEDIPAATQLFTPNWIVKYMVQNTLGRQWLATYPNSSIKSEMAYYIDPGEQPPEVQQQLKDATPQSLNPEALTLLDPACGSGHILVEAYDLLKRIYQERGYRTKDIPRLILKKNLFGLEIDDRAAQLAAFALMMKARADDRRIFGNGAKPQVFSIQETKGLDAKEITEALNAPILKSEPLPRETLFEELDEAKAPLFSRKNLSSKGEIHVVDIAELVDLFTHGKTFGALIRVPEELAQKLPAITKRVEDVLIYGGMFPKRVAETLLPIVEQTLVLARRYDAVVTNPPYMGGKGMNALIKDFAQKSYPSSKPDLFAMFIQRNLELANLKGAVGIITMQSWMFLSSFEKLRAMLLNQFTIVSMLHLGARAFDSIGGEVVSTTAFVLDNNYSPSYKSIYLRLTDGNSEAEKRNAMLEAIQNSECGWFFRASAADFKKIPGSPIAYWVSESARDTFMNGSEFGKLAEPRLGMATGDNNTYVRLWHEVSFSKVGLGMTRTKAKQSKLKWFPYNKGGEFKRWYGNNECVVNWENDGHRLQSTMHPSGNRIWAHNFNLEYIFKPGLTWTFVSSSCFGVRYSPIGFLFDVGGSSAFPKEKDTNFLLGYLCSSVAFHLLKALNPTLNFQAGNIEKLPVIDMESHIKEKVENIVKSCVSLSKFDWDLHETSWDFEIFPVLESSYHDSKLKSSFKKLHSYCYEIILTMQNLEQQNSRIFIDHYGLQNELTPYVPLTEITLTCNPHYRYGGDKSEDELEALLLSDTMRELISYAVGCMMGRYSLDSPGLIYAHSGNKQFWEIYRSKHNQPAPSAGEKPSSTSWLRFHPDDDGIVPITDTDWFPDDAANRFIEFISVAWSKEHLEENLKFVADGLGPNRGESARDTIRRYLATGFYKHHLSMYKKRPIYWLFSSGKQRAFQCLVYLHRYNEGTLSRMRTEYVIPLQGKINARIDQLKDDIEAASSTSHRKSLEKERDKLVRHQRELQSFDEMLRHFADQRISLDLDDGVKMNYAKFGDLLAEVKAVTGKQES